MNGGTNGPAGIPMNGSTASAQEAMERIAALEEIIAGQRAELGLLRLQLEMLSATDVITGLPNLTGIMQTLEKQLARHRRTAEPFGIMLIEADGIETTEGAGQEALHDALRHCGAMISAALRQSDTVGRIDERTFAAVLPDLSRDGAGVVMGRIDANLRTMPPGPIDAPTRLTPRLSVVLIDGAFAGDATDLMEGINRLRVEAKPGEPTIIESSDLAAS